MVKSVWFEGVHSFVPAGKAPVFGETVEISFNRPQNSLWDENKWFCFDIQIDQFSEGKAFARFFPKGGGEPLVTTYEILPNVKVSFRVQLDELWSKRFFLPTFPGSYKGHCSGKPTDPATIERVEVGIRVGKDFKDARLMQVYVAEEEPRVFTPERPMIDEMGQLMGFDWPTKTHSVAQMKERLTNDYNAAVAAGTDEKTKEKRNLSKYGGYLAKPFKATGWFRTEHDGNRWWLVDPDGYGFFSHGICYGTRMGEFGWFTGMEAFYENPPSPQDPLYKQAFTHPYLIAEYVKRHGETKRSNDWMYNPARANMMKVFGENWWEAWQKITTHRFNDWGFNTTGIGIVNFVDERTEDFLSKAKIPYVVTLKRFPITKNFIFRDFPDVFSEEYEKNSAVFAQNELAPMGEDPYLLGYFLHNEPEWMFQADCCIAYELLVKDAPLKSRKGQMEWLKNRYGTIEKLNEAWNIQLKSWEDLLEPVSRQWEPNAKAWEDLLEYEPILIKAFGEVPLKACKKVAPNHLCLGMRYSRITDKIIEASTIFDVFSFNSYRRSAMPQMEFAKKTNKPIMIGEWHFGGQEVGLLRTALQSCVNQEERAKACKQFLQEVAADPCCIGAHYFEYNDQTLMGRFDGEHMAHGIIDCTNRPYPPMAKAISETSDVLFDVVTGKKAPYRDENIAYLEPHW